MAEEETDLKKLYDESKQQFDNDEIKEQMLHGDVNPFNTAFVVDVKIQTIQDKPAVYKVVKLHELIDVNDEENNIQNLTNENN